MKMDGLGAAGAGAVSHSSSTHEAGAAGAHAPEPTPGVSVEPFAEAPSRSAGEGPQLRKGLEPAIAKIAKQNPDPTNVLGDVALKDSQVGPLLTALQTEPNHALLGRMSEAELETTMEDLAHRSWPELPEQQKHELAMVLASKVREHAKFDAAFKMRDAAVDAMSSAADQLEGLSKDPRQLAQLKQQLSGPATHQTEELRARLGIDDPSRLSRLDDSELGRRIATRAELVRHEAGELKRAGANRIFMVCGDHKVADLYMERAGIQPGSVAGRQVDAAREQGKSDAESIEHMKLACSIAAAVATGGLGVGLAGAAVTAGGSAVMNAGSVYEKYKAIDAAKAGETAGTKELGAVGDAKWNFGVAAGVAGAEVALGGVVANQGAHLLEKVVSHEVGHAVSHVAVTVSAFALEQALSKHED